MTGSASVIATMRNSFCISNILLVKFQRLLRQAEAEVKITDVVQGHGDVAVFIVFRRRGAQRLNRAGRAQIFGLAPLLFSAAPAPVERRNAARFRNYSILPKRRTMPVEIRRLLLVLLPLAALSLNFVST